MRARLYQYPRGVNRGGIPLQGKVAPTMSSSSWNNNVFLIEMYEEDDNGSVPLGRRPQAGEQKQG